MQIIDSTKIKLSSKFAQGVMPTSASAWLCWSFVCLASVFAAWPAFAAEAPAERPVMQAFTLQTAPTLDGNILNDPAWSGVVPATGFWQVQPNEGQPATQKTEVFIGYTEEALFIGVVAYDDNPENIIVTDGRRDASLNETDSFRVIIDGLHDKQNGFIFGTNPVGMEYDAQVVKEGNGFNLNWDTSWSVKAGITDLGWVAEMRIPFKSLRYHNGGEQVWGINFQGNRKGPMGKFGGIDLQSSI